MDKRSLQIEVESALEHIQYVLDECITDVDKAFKEEESVLNGDCSFPIVWSIGASPCDGEGGDPIEDPFVLRVHSSEELTDPNTKYDISLQDAVTSLIEMLQADEDMTGVAMEVRDALSELADQITMALEAQ